MLSLLRPLGAVASAAILAAAAAPSIAQTPPAADTRPPCVRMLVALDDTIDSARAKAGQVFTFRLTEPAVTRDGTPVPTDALGYGIVANVQHAERGGRPGYLALETRFFTVADGRHVTAVIDRANDEASTAVGSTANAPALLGLIPIVGYAVGGYDSLHHGKDATIPKGTRLAVFLGDESTLGACRPLVAGEQPPPMPTERPAVQPVAVPAPPQAPALAPTPTPSTRP